MSFVIGLLKIALCTLSIAKRRRITRGINQRYIKKNVRTLLFGRKVLSQKTILRVLKFLWRVF